MQRADIFVGTRSSAGEILLSSRPVHCELALSVLPKAFVKKLPYFTQYLAPFRFHALLFSPLEADKLL